VIKEKLGEVTKVLAVNLLLGAVHLEHGHVAVAVYFIARRVPKTASPKMPPQKLLRLVEIQTKFAEIKLVHIGILFGKGGKIPRVDGVLSELDAVDVLDFGDALVFSDALLIHAVVPFLPLQMKFRQPCASLQSYPKLLWKAQTQLGRQQPTHPNAC
jgi:hypothetical protein